MGPMLKAFATLNDIASKSLEDELLDLTARSNSAHSWHVVRPE